MHVAAGANLWEENISKPKGPGLLQGCTPSIINYHHHPITNQNITITIPPLSLSKQSLLYLHHYYTTFPTISILTSKFPHYHILTITILNIFGYWLYVMWSFWAANCSSNFRSKTSKWMARNCKLFRALLYLARLSVIDKVRIM